MALRTYWCVLSRRGTTAIRSRTVFNQVDQFTCELDLDMSHTIRAAFLNGLRQHAGEDADPGEYRMYVYGDPGYSQVVLARLLRVSTKSAYQWRRRWRAGCPSALA